MANAIYMKCYIYETVFVFFEGFNGEKLCNQLLDTINLIFKFISLISHTVLLVCELLFVFYHICICILICICICICICRGVVIEKNEFNDFVTSW